MRRASLGCLALLLAATPAGAAETAAFLRILPGARPMAMGEAFTAVADDLNALTTNPSGLSRLDGRQAGFMHAQLYGGARYDFLGYAQPFARGAFGLSVQRLAQGGLEGRDAAGQQTGAFGAADTALTAAASMRLAGSPAMAGLAVKLIESRLADASARTVALDAGLLRPLGGLAVPFTVAVAARNVGPGLRYGDVREDLPLTLAAGASARLAGVVLIAAEVTDRPHAQQLGFNLGTEYALLPAFSVRAGLAGLQTSAAPGFGFGLKLRGASIDYGFTPAGELGATQRLSLSSRF